MCRFRFSQKRREIMRKHKNESTLVGHFKSGQTHVPKVFVWTRSKSHALAREVNASCEHWQYDNCVQDFGIGLDMVGHETRRDRWTMMHLDLPPTSFIFREALWRDAGAGVKNRYITWYPLRFRSTKSKDFWHFRQNIWYKNDLSKLSPLLMSDLLRANAPCRPTSL